MIEQVAMTSNGVIAAEHARESTALFRTLARVLLAVGRAATLQAAQLAAWGGEVDTVGRHRARGGFAFCFGAGGLCHDKTP